MKPEALSVRVWALLGALSPGSLARQILGSILAPPAVTGGGRGSSGWLQVHL
ncbi:MAG TPA: hypothetical protein VJV79_20555 [Polyangiaceae bacterium]|nr:hypothetical protein [Polyangiaceae bacterium]